MRRRDFVQAAGQAAGRLWAVVQLLRPLNVVMIVVGVGVGGVLSGGVAAVQGTNGTRLLGAALSAALIGGAANALNDVFDLATDRVNRPGRPLPSGLVSVGVAKTLAALGTVGGLALAAMLSRVHLALALGVVGLLFIYNVALKRTVLVGNLVIALVLGVALVYGGWAVGPPEPALLGAVFAFLTTLAREIVKDVEDVAGDVVAGVRTLPVVTGSRVAVRIAVGVLFLTLLLTPLPFLLFDYTGIFLLVMLAAAALLLYACWLLLAPRPEAQAGRASRIVKAVMVAGMIALTLGAVVELGG